MRLGFSVAVHVDPAVMIIDEGLAVGDTHFREKCHERIEGFRRAGKTMLMVAHDVGIVRRFCNRVIWLRRGTLIADGRVEDVLPRYEAVARREILTSDREEEEEDKVLAMLR